MLTWYQRLPGYGILILMIMETFELMRAGLYFFLFFPITVLVLLAMMGLSAPERHAGLGRRLVFACALGVGGIYVVYLASLARLGVVFTAADLLPALRIFLSPGLLLGFSIWWHWRAARLQA
jgi:hypothetical protein